MVSGEVDVFAGIEHVDSDAVAEHMHVAVVRGERRLRRVAAKEVLDLRLLRRP